MAEKMVFCLADGLAKKAHIMYSEKKNLRKEVNANLVRGLP